MKISGGVRENDIVIGNNYDKYGSKNPVVRLLMSGFHASLAEFVERVSPRTIHEIGCGEGFWSMQWNRQKIYARGSDFSEQVIEMARDNAVMHGLPAEIFKQRSIYDLCPEEDGADLIVCCEVLEHLDAPDAGLSALQKVVEQHVILSVPVEPLWRVLNCLRGKYLRQLGNTPGHRQHWSSTEFRRLVSRYFDIIDVKTPLPWVMVLARAQN